MNDVVNVRVNVDVNECGEIENDDDSEDEIELSVVTCTKNDPIRRVNDVDEESVEENESDVENAPRASSINASVTRPGKVPGSAGVAKTELAPRTLLCDIFGLSNASEVANEKFEADVVIIV